MNPTRRALLGGIGAAALLPRFAYAASLPDQKILQLSLELLHPGLYRYQSRTAWASAFTRFERAFGSASDLSGRYLALSRLLGNIRCGHSYGNFFNQTEAAARLLFTGPTRLPFRFRWIGERMVVTDGQASNLSPGTLIHSVDGVPSRQILAGLLPLTRADGSNDGKRRGLLSVEGEQRIETFDVYHPLLFPPRGSRAELVAETPEGKRRTLWLERIDLAARQASMPPGSLDRGSRLGWRIEFVTSAAILTMPSWSVYNSSWDWRGWLHSQFEEIASRSTQALILDLRANEGGRDCGNDILARMIKAPLPLARYRRLVRFRRVPAMLRPYLDTWDRSFDNLGEQAEPVGDGFFRLPAEEEVDSIAPLAPHFSGRLIVLVGPQNSSATFQFANLVRQHRLGVLVGETTGGNRRGINGGAFYFLRLPESGLEADIPLIGSFPSTPQPDAGIEPDVRVVQTSRDLAAGRDPAMERALALAKG